MSDLTKSLFLEHIAVAHSSLQLLETKIDQVARVAISTLQNGNKILLCGNGGSAADAQHIASELTGRFHLRRRALPAIALTTDSSALTSIGNDFGYEKLFSRQLEALGSSGDLLIVLSTSGESENIVQVLKTAGRMGIRTAGLGGKEGGRMAPLCDIALIVPSMATPRIQEVHILIGHIICQLIDEAFATSQP